MAPKLRRFMHVAAAVILHYSAALFLYRWLRRNVFRKGEVCVLGLHRVLTNEEQQHSNSLDGMIILEETYLALLEYLQSRFTVISLDGFLSGMSQFASTKPPCVITFDDGWADTYSRAFPGLKKFGLPAVIFLATGAIGTRGGFWVEQLKQAWQAPETRARANGAFSKHLRANMHIDLDLEAVVEWLKRMPSAHRDKILESMLPVNGFSSENTTVDAMVTWEQAKEMSTSGVEIGAHTVSHPLLTYERKADVDCELRVSKQTLEARLGQKVRAFAYPNGDWNEAVREQVAQAGYQCAFTTKPAWHNCGENPYTISRILLHQGNITGQTGRFSPAMLDLALAGWA